MSLREKVEEAIRAANGDVGKASIAICLVFEDALDLAGNGWWDDDQVMLQALVDNGVYESDDGEEEE